MRAAALVLAAAAALLAGCGSAPEPVPVPPPAAALSPADTDACARHGETARVLRREAQTYASMPVPPVRVALVLAATWEFYNAPGTQDPVLTAAMAEVAAAIGDLDAQGQAKLTPETTLMDPVQLDPARTTAAVDAVDRVCAGQPG
ncbi:MAG: hypothetical protein ACT4RN_22145 [Pseudonocardia sp.]